MHKNVSKLLALLLCLCLLLTGAPGIAALAVGDDDEPAENPAESASRLQDLDPATLGVHKLGEIDEQEIIPDTSALTPDTSLNELVRVSVFLTEPSAVDAGYSAQGIGRNGSATSYRATLRTHQKNIQAAIENKIGYSLDVVWNLTLLTNAFSTWVKVKDIPAIERVDGVRSVQRENLYTVPSPATAEPDTAVTSSVMTGAAGTWAAGYTGAGTRIAIIDTGIDPTHISFDGDAFDYAIEQEEKATGRTYDVLTEEDIPSAALNGEGVYLSSKIPYAYNYIDGNLTINHLSDTEGEHGSHVAGIAAANRFVKDGDSFADSVETVHAVGMAPDAQLLVMKVFGAGGGAYDSDYYAAIEDAIAMDADAVNLSLGGAAPGFTYDNVYQDVLNALADSETNAGMVASISAGNSGAFTDYNIYGLDLFIDDVSMHTGGSPGSFINSLGVASADNVGNTGSPLRFDDTLNVYITEAESDGGQFTDIPGTYDYVYIDTIGEADDYSAVDAAVSLQGKIVIVNRGSTTFVEKGNNAIDYAPAGVLIANNQPGTIGMQLDGFTGTFPMASFTLADANTVKSLSSAKETGGITYYTGSVKVTSEVAHEVVADRSDAVVSDFSSWGVPGSLLMKPEITAPGGSIYSVAGTNKTKTGIAGGSDKYELMSGTSMAAPHIAGLSALTAQYLKEADYAEMNAALAEEYSRRAIIQSLLMSTATPMTDDYGYISILQQGAGLADVSRAVNASSVIMMKDAGLTTYTGAAADGKVKVELGDDPSRTGEYGYSFTVYNLTDRDLSYELDTDVFTQDLYQAYGLLFMDRGTRSLNASVSYDYEQDLDDPHDVNKDGVTDDADAQAVLDYVSGENDGSALDLAAAEMDGDGKISSHDAYLLLQFSETVAGQLVVRAGSSKDVTVYIAIGDEDKAFLDEYYTSGAYVEGYTYVTCVTKTAEGELIDDEHSIPVLGFYGNWTDPSMFDNTSFTDLIYGTDLANYSGNDYTNYLTMKYGSALSIFTGNPYIAEDEFPSDALAVNSKDQFVSLNYNLIRSAGTTGFAVSRTDGVGGDVTEVITSSLEAYDTDPLYYYVNGGTWENTGTKSYGLNKKPAAYGLSEGDTFRIGFYAIPEYYGMLMHAYDMTAAYTGNLYDEEEFNYLLEANVLGRGAFVGYDFAIDDTAPVIESAYLDGTDIWVSATDNMNLAYVAILSLDGEVTYAEYAPHSPEYTDGTFDAARAIEEAEGYVAVFAADYAGNEVAKALQVNDNVTVDPLAVASISIDPATLDIYKGNEVDLSAEILPLTVEDRRVTWTSSDETVVVVDEAGHLTAVDAGTATVTVTAVSDETKSAECQVKVTRIDQQVNGIIWDEAGEVYFSTFNTNGLPAWTRLHDTKASADVRTTLVEDDGDIYAATLDTSSASSTIYTVDPATYGLTEYSDNYLWAADMAAGATDAYGLDEYIGMVYSYAYFLLAGPVAPEDDGTGAQFSGVPYGFGNFSEKLDGAYIAGVAALMRDAFGGIYAFVDETGKIWMTELGPTVDDQGRLTGFEFSEPELLVDTGIKTSFLYQDLYCDGTWLYWSHYADNVSTLYAFDLDNGVMYDCGNFGEGVWPASGLYDGAAPVSDEDEGAQFTSVEAVRADVTRESLMTSEIAGRLAAAAAKGPAGGTNAAKLTEKPLARNGAEKQSVEGTADVNGAEGTATVTLTEDVDVTNGLVTVSYTEGLTLADVESPVLYSAHVDEEARTVTIAYASAAAVTAGDTIAQLVFEVESSGKAEVTVSERNDDVTVTEEEPEEIEIVSVKPVFKSKSLVLSGQIGVNFFMDLPEIDGVDYSESYMEFTVGSSEPVRVDFDENSMNSSKTYYRFTCFVTSIQMADTIKAVFHYGDGQTVEAEYSVEQYIAYFDEHSSSFNAKVIDLIHALADYGYYSQLFLSETNGWKLGEDYAAMTLHYADGYDFDAVKAAVAGYKFVKELDGSKVTKATYKLVLDSTTALDVILTVEKGTELTASAEFNGNTFEAEKLADGRYRVRIPDISAHQLGDTVTVTGEAGGAFTVAVAPLSYVRSVLNSASFGETAKNSMAAMYTYFEKVMAYRA